jgi:PAS domain S-box-containing protein
MADDLKVTDSNYLELLLQQAHDRISLAVDAAGIGFWDWNLVTNEVFLDEHWLSMLGFKDGEIENHRSFWEECIHPEDKGMVMKTLQNHFKNINSAYKTEHRVCTKSGDYIWILDSGRVIERDSDNTPKRIIGISIDITEKVLARQRIYESEEKYKSIFEHLNDAFCSFDFSGQILEINKNLCDLIGVKSEELRNNNINLYVGNKNLKYLHRRLTYILEKKSINFETEIITPKRRVIPISISARLITTAENGIIQALIRDITERKSQEKALLDEKQKFKALLEHSPNVISRYGRNFKCQYISPNVSKIMGINAEEFIGKRLAEVNFPPSLASHIEEKMKWIFRKNKEQTINFSFDTFFGKKHFESIMVPETNGSNVVETILITTSDNTEQVNNERELNFSIQKLEDAERNVHFGIFEMNLVQGIMTWSKEMYQIFERDPQLAPMTIEEFHNEIVHPDDCAMVAENFTQSIKTGSNFNITYRINTYSGKTKYVSSAGKVINDVETGVPLSMHGTLMDITEKKQIENRLFSERDILQIIMDNVPDAIYFKDNQGRYLRANKGFAKLFGFDDPERLIGKTHFDVFPQEIADRIHENEQSIFISGIPLLNQEREIPTPWGNVWLSATIVGIKDFNGQVNQLVGISRDISQYKLVEDQLRKAKEKAEQADKLKSTFLANMSHEIRTPINGILGFANLMEMRDFERDKQIQYLRIINNSGHVLLSLINDIIDIAKIEAEQINIEYTEVDFHALLHDLHEFYQGEKIRRRKEHVEIDLVVPENPISQLIITDPLRLSQIINNLISNALKFTESGHIKFGYKIEQDQVIVFVKDTGIGLSADESKIIFERFKQVGKSSKKNEGTGLGLAISKGLVELLGGNIWVNSELGAGSEFSFTFLYRESNNQAIEINRPPLIKVADCKWKGKTLLLVEDELVNYTYIYDLLEGSGIKILHVTTAEEAICICQTQQIIDIILMDIRLPGISGFEATSAIKKIRKEVPIIAQTAYAMENEKKQCFEAGCDQYLTKPFDQALLLQVINNHLQFSN